MHLDAPIFLAADDPGILGGFELFEDLARDAIHV
jgi:hypothetical protein